MLISYFASMVDRDAPSSQEFAREQADRMRTRLRWVLWFMLALWSFAFLFADVRLYGSRSEKLVVRVIELLWTAAVLWWLREPRSVAAIERVVVPAALALVAVTSYTILWLSPDQVNFAVTARLLILWFFVYFIELRWRAAAVSYLACLSIIIGVYLYRERFDGLRNVAQAAMWILVPAPLLVRAAKRREEQQREAFELRRELAEKNALLEQQSTLRDRLFAQLGHDLRTPLTVIRGELELSARDLHGDARASVERALSNTVFASDLCDQLLELARIDAGDAVSRPHDVAMHTLVGDLCVQLRPRGGASLSWEGEPFVAFADALQLRRILANLFANAIAQVDPKRGSVRIVLSCEHERGRVDVIDDGPGVPPSQRATLFHRDSLFARRAGAPSGIGLPLAFELAKRQGGSLTLLEQTPTTFRLELPTSQRRPDAAPLDAAREPRGAHLLVVEDNEDLRELLLKAFSSRFTVTTAASLAEARAALDQGPIEAVLCDVMLPDGEGFELLDELRVARSNEQLPFVFVSARADLRDRVRGIEAGADDYVTKPFSLDELVTRVERAMRRTRTHREDSERQRQALMMELHDGVSSNLTNARLLLDSGHAESVRAARQLVTEALVETRAAFDLIDRESVSIGELFASIRRSASDRAEPLGVAVEFRETFSNPTVERRSLSAIRAHAARRLAAEGVTNVLRHAGATRIELTLIADNDHVEIVLDDDGRGIAEGVEGRGTRLARQRAARAGGALVILPRDGGGTRFHASISLC